MSSDFIRKLENSTAHRQSRELISDSICANPELLPVLMGVLLDTKNKNHYKACWTSELVFEKHIEWLIPYLDVFSKTLSSYSHDGALRSVSKICLFSATYHLKKKKSGAIFLTDEQLELMVESCFDWLISDQKVATKAYAMRALYAFGKINDWIYPELKTILTQDYPNHSAAYKLASKEILKKLK
ncbi:hypothetical protein [Flavobacterium lindanitolerans]|uniref:hypothetical protein n=1 Tax=Flavobacterium lindanitolerans TaxID=428988 RepID=UPI002809F6C4|nr:hypothetical protein [Flavobacterium lindanitolerans]MDQ7959797.1 hypothetical protein [Flavobacterium lindanitolerans]